jgi:hypothetical protein
MNKIFTIRGRAAKGLKTCAAAVSMIVMISTGTSWAFTTYDGYQDVPPLKVKSVTLQSPLQYQPSSAVTDSCLPLLKSFQETSSKSVTDRNQRSAGKVAAPVVAMGLIFGVRYALTPPGSAPAYKANFNENKLGNFDVWHDNGTSLSGNTRPALAVSAYRACQKKQALIALSDNR